MSTFVTPLRCPPWVRENPAEQHVLEKHLGVDTSHPEREDPAGAFGTIREVMP